jgi:uncharacterized membrane protein YgcG
MDMRDLASKIYENPDPFLKALGEYLGYLRRNQVALGYANKYLEQTARALRAPLKYGKAAKNKSWFIRVFLNFFSPSKEPYGNILVNPIRLSFAEYLGRLYGVPVNLSNNYEFNRKYFKVDGGEDVEESEDRPAIEKRIKFARFKFDPSRFNVFVPKISIVDEEVADKERKKSKMEQLLDNIKERMGRSVGEAEEEEVTGEETASGGARTGPSYGGGWGGRSRGGPSSGGGGGSFSGGGGPGGGAAQSGPESTPPPSGQADLPPWVSESTRTRARSKPEGVAFTPPRGVQDFPEPEQDEAVSKPADREGTPKDISVSPESLKLVRDLLLKAHRQHVEPVQSADYKLPELSEESKSIVRDFLLKAHRQWAAGKSKNVDYKIPDLSEESKAIVRELLIKAHDAYVKPAKPERAIQIPEISQESLAIVRSILSGAHASFANPAATGPVSAEAAVAVSDEARNFVREAIKKALAS